ncbi:MAG: hypothetical protein IPJ19_15870 [Planctomycetes bacterium]|nr:hypothetical protein [Planctomycetota bacterium]
MTRSQTGEEQKLRCPRCGAAVEDPLAGHCVCCGSTLGLGGRNAKGERVPLSMSMGMGQALAQSHERALSPVEGAARASRTGQGLSLVRSHRLYEQWMEDSPSGFLDMLGLAGIVALGVLFIVLALGDFFHASHRVHSTLPPPVFVVLGLCVSGFGVWKIVRFYQAPLLRRPACVVDERTRISRTKYGWSTHHYAVFEVEGGLREEFRVSSRLADSLARGDCGVLITRDTFLLAFHS